MTAPTVGLVIALILGGCSSLKHPGARTSRTSVSAWARPTSIPASSPASSPVSASASTSTVVSGKPQPAHVVVVVIENHAFGEVLGSSSAPFLNRLAARGAAFTQFYAVTHPSEPNYLALFSGSTQGLTSDACPVRYAGANLASSLLDAGKTFTGYAEDLPRSGFKGCSRGAYARKHCPWIDFSNVPVRVSQPMSSFPSDYTLLPTVSFVVPNLRHDMHDGTVAEADSWLQQHMSGYADWAEAHNSLLVVTADEDDKSADNRIPVIISGAGVKAGEYGKRYNLYSLLRLIEDLYRLPRIANTASAIPIDGIWG
jgi:phosphatidylinositol-3-phosphatase